MLQHGFTDSLESWYDLGYVEALKPRYRLILIDARGHGASDKPHQPDAYDRERNIEDITAVLNDVDVPERTISAIRWEAELVSPSPDMPPSASVP